MKTATTTKTATPPTRPTLTEAREAAQAAQAEVGRLRRIASGEVHTRTTTREPHTFFDAKWQRQETEVLVERDVVTRVDPVQRALAKQALPAAEQTWLDAEATLAVAEEEAARAEAARQAGHKRTGRTVLQERWPALVRDLRVAQARMVAMAEEMNALDTILGARYFAEASWPFLLPGGAVDEWITRTTAMFSLTDDVGAARR